MGQLHGLEVLLVALLLGVHHFPVPRLARFFLLAAPLLGLLLVPDALLFRRGQPLLHLLQRSLRVHQFGDHLQHVTHGAPTFGLEPFGRGRRVFPRLLCFFARCFHITL
jgi:hypothetical protein